MERMFLSRVIRLFLFLLLSMGSVSHAFQLPKSVSKIALPSAINRAAAVSKPRPAQLHTPVSSHVHFPKRKSRSHQPHVKEFGRAAKGHSIVRSHRTSVTANSGTVTLSVDVGRPIQALSKVSVKNAPPGMKFSSVRWPSLARGLPSGVMLLSEQDGRPEYPMLTFTFTIPANASAITPTLKPVSAIPLGNIHFPPSMKKIKGVLERIYDANSNAAPSLTIGRPRTFRSLRMVTVSVPLVSSNGGAATALEKFTVGINFSLSAAPSVASSATRDPVFADLDSRLVANTWDLSSFTVPLRGPLRKPLLAKPSISKSLKSGAAPLGTDPLIGWIDTNAAYIRLAVTRDGLYRVNASDLNFPPNQNFTLATSGWTAKNVRCFNHGVEVPLWIDTDVTGSIADIEFYGQHLRGFSLPTVTNSYLSYDYHVQEGLNFQWSDTSVRLSEYYNVATDTNVYWLTSSGDTSAPLRYVAKSLIPTSAPVVSSGTVLLHHEEDKNYYKGDAAEDQTQTEEMTEYVPGERFEWAELHGTLDNPALSHFTDTFYISQLPSDTAGKVATLSFLFRGMSFETSDVGHTVQAEVGGIQSLQSNFLGYIYDSLTMTVPLSHLVAGANEVNISAFTLGDTIDEFYLDYYEVRMENGLAPSTDTGIVKGQWLFSISPTSAKFQLGMTDGSAHLYNLMDNTRILDPSSQFFDSTSSIQPHYAAATTATLLKCDNIQPWNTKSGNVLSWQILNHTNQCDYLIITHPDFEQAAQKLALFQGNQGLKTKIVTTDEIFNAFDYGSNEPEAIRRYLSYAYYNYSGTPVSLVTLLGNASWDPKFNLPGGIQRSFVPTYGHPVSDSYFTIPESDSNLDSLPLMMIARIPVASEAAAETYLTKLREYETAIPAPWNRRFLFIAGGDRGLEHASFDDYYQSWLNPAPPFGNLGLIAPPMNIQDTIIDRTDFSSGVDATHVGQIEDLLLTGQSVMYFGGHGATFTSDVAFPDASIIQNKGLYPLLLTLTCQTGDFAEPSQVTVNQSYIEAPEAGSVQAYGTTGFGEEGYDGQLTSNWITLMESFDSTHDTTRPETINMLELLTAAKLSVDYVGDASVSHNEALQNSMLGDAAMGFVLRPQPELAVYSSEVHGYIPGDTAPRTVFSVSDSIITIRALIHNYGYSTDRPVVIEITDAGPSGFPASIFDTLLHGINDSAYVSASFVLTAQSIGLHQISVAIDPGHRFPEFYRGDDSTSIQISVSGLSTTAFFPYEGERELCDIGPDSVHFIVLTPQGSTPNDEVELELDTTHAFSHILADRKTSIGSAYYVTFGVTIPAAPVPVSSVYWWRTRVVRASGETTDWQPATFSTASAPRSEFSYTSTEQLASTVVNGLDINSRGMLYLPQQDTMRIEAISHGLDDSVLGQTFAPYAQVFVNGRFFWQDSGYFNGSPFDNGFVILIWTPDGTQIDTVYQFEMPWQNIGDTSFENSMAKTFDSVIAAIPQTRLVMVLTVGSVEFWQFFFPAVQGQMQSLGSAKGMSPMAYRGSYALIGTKGSAPGTAKETFAGDGSGGANAFDTIITAGTSGFAETPYTAVAKDYGALSWTGDPIVAGDDINFIVLGSRRDGSGVDVVGSFKASAGNSFSLSSVDPRMYDRLGVQMGFVRMTSTTQSPALSGIALQYDPAPEFTFAGDSIQCIPKLVNAGGTVIANYTATTLTCTPGDSVLVLLVRQSQGKIDTPVKYLIPLIAGHGTQLLSDTLQTLNELGAASLTAAINPNEAQNEQLLFNNTLNGSYTITRDTMSPTAEILFADPTDKIPQQIPDCSSGMNASYVSSRSIITIQMFSGNPLRDTSSSSITAYFVDESNTKLDFTVAAGNAPSGIQATFQTLRGGQLQAQLIITPATDTFAAGQWIMKAFIRDASGNTDTVEQCFTVSNVNGIEEVMNYPNPFKETTDFTFILKSDAPADIKIVVYTIAGRKIRTLTPKVLHAGFNAVPWDGRDERGNEVANGTYLYRVVINGTNGDKVSDAVTQTAVRAR